MSKDTIHHSEKIGKREASVLEIQVDGSWTVSDVAAFFKCINDLYKIINTVESFLDFSTMHKIHPDPEFNVMSRHWAIHYFTFTKYEPLIWRNTRFDQREYTFRSKPRIRSRSQNWYEHIDPRPIEVLQLSYASPGSFDLLGLAKVFEVISNLIARYLPNEKERIETELAEEELLTQKILNLKAAGFSELDIQNILFEKEKKLTVIRELVLEKKIVGVRQRD